MWALMPCHLDPFLEKLPAFLGFNLTMVGPSTLSSMSSVTAPASASHPQINGSRKEMGGGGSY